MYDLGFKLYFKPYRFKFIKKYLLNSEFHILDVGAGNHSAIRTKYYFPNCRYYGIDLNKNYNNNEKDFKLMEMFWEMDLTKVTFQDIPPNTFDIIVMSHVIEHLPNGDDVLIALFPKLKLSGYIYLEFPSPKTTKYPKGLNFYDDATHVRVYSVPEISKILTDNNFKIHDCGIRHYIPRILLAPFLAIYQIIRHGRVGLGIFSDIVGFSEYIVAQRNPSINNATE